RSTTCSSTAIKIRSSEWAEAECKAHLERQFRSRNFAPPRVARRSGAPTRSGVNFISSLVRGGRRRSRVHVEQGEVRGLRIVVVVEEEGMVVATFGRKIIEPSAVVAQTPHGHAGDVLGVLGENVEE